VSPRGIGKAGGHIRNVNEQHVNDVTIARGVSSLPVGAKELIGVRVDFHHLIASPQ
jgi:hypothetical protein